MNYRWLSSKRCFNLCEPFRAKAKRLCAPNDEYAFFYTSSTCSGYHIDLLFPFSYFSTDITAKYNEISMFI